MTTTTIRSTSQIRGQHAFECVRKVKEMRESERKDYKQEAKKLPMRAKASGLGQALAFIHSKSGKKPALHSLHRDLTDWVIKKREFVADPDDGKLLLEYIIESDSAFLRWATDETMAYLEWLNRFLEAEIQDKGE